MAQRRSWGNVRRLASGRYQARYKVDGVEHLAPDTFRTKRDADEFLAAVRADLGRGTWINPDRGTVTLQKYATRWLSERPALRPRTRELYEGQLRLHILPALGDLPLAKITTSGVRTWHAGLLSEGRLSASTVAKCYRLLRTILGTAVEDELITKNPCVIKGAGVERAAERPVATVEQVLELADSIEPRFRAMVLLAGFLGLRLGELLALTHRRLDLLHGTLSVTEQLQELADGSYLLGPPKTDAGMRTVSIPRAIIPDLEAHLGGWAAPGSDGLLFCSPDGSYVRRTTVQRAWRRATGDVGLDGFRFHDLRHTGNTLTASAGASTKELMVRMGHSSSRAALIYQHASSVRDAEIAECLSKTIDRHRRS
jgi:integrase